MSTILTTERLRLRPFSESDIDAAYVLWSDPKVVRYMRTEPMTRDQVTVHVQTLIATINAPERRDFHFAIVHSGSNRLIGWCTLRVHDPENREADIGYAICRGAWGNGYTTEAACALLAFGFGALNLHRICARCVPENLASVRVIEKIGMVCEGHKRKHRWIKGAWWDSRDHAILDEEWEALQTKDSAER